MKILSVCTVYPTAEDPTAGIFIRSRLQALASLAEVKVLAPFAIFSYTGGRIRSKHAQPRTRRDGRLEVLSPRWWYPPAGGAWNAFFLFLCILIPVCRLRRKFPFAILDAHFGHPEGTATALLASVLRCPFSVTLRGSEVLHGNHALRRFSMGCALRRAALVITVSERLRQYAISLGVRSERTKVIPNGVNAEVFYPRDRAATRKKWSLADSRRAVLSAGHLIELKGHHRVVRAVAKLAAAGCEAELLIAGASGRGSDFRDAIAQEAASVGLGPRVRFLGELSQTDLAEVMSAADILCLASSREGWPNVVMEAMSCGLPVVATDVGAVPEMIPSAEYGIIVPVDNDNALADALAEALGKAWNREQIARWGKSRSWDQVALEVYRQFSLTLERST